MNKRYLKTIASAALLAMGLIASTQAASSNGLAGAIPAYYDHELFTILFVEFSPQAERSILQHNTALNFIYQSDAGLPGNEPFISVIDAVPGDGFNPIWEEVQINFTAGNTPRQLFSDDEIED